MEETKNSKGSSVRKMRKIAIWLYAILATVVIFIIIVVMVNTDTVPDLNNSPFFGLSLIFFISLFTDNKDKLEQHKPWYKNKWGWLIAIMALMTLPILLPILLFLTLTIHEIRG